MNHDGKNNRIGWQTLVVIKRVRIIEFTDY